jgi:DNA-dependent RNA polymerase auxiliary subunit epsilon
VGARKKVTPNKKPKKPRRQYGEDWLDRIAALTLKLENGETATFDIAKEVTIPAVTLSELRELERTVPARYAFWAGQVARQRREVQKCKRRLTKAEADADVVCRKFVLEDTDYQITERTVRSHVDLQPSVKKARTKLDEAEYQLELLESVRDAVHTLTFSVGRLLNTYAVAKER